MGWLDDQAAELGLSDDDLLSQPLSDDDEKLPGDDEDLLGDVENDELKSVLDDFEALKAGIKEKADAEAAQKALVEKQMQDYWESQPGYQPPHEDSPIEKAAVDIAKRDMAEMYDLLKTARDKQDAQYRSHLPGFDADGELVLEPDPFDASTLTRAEFSRFMKAMAAGYSPEDWQKSERDLA